MRDYYRCSVFSRTDPAVVGCCCFETQAVWSKGGQSMRLMG